MDEEEHKEKLKDFAGIGKAIATILVKTSDQEITPDEAFDEHNALLQMAGFDFETLSAATQMFLNITLEVIEELTETPKQEIVNNIYNHLMEDIEERY